jgi:hypothetical protein
VLTIPDASHSTFCNPPRDDSTVGRQTVESIVGRFFNLAGMFWATGSLRAFQKIRTISPVKNCAMGANHAKHDD